MLFIGALIRKELRHQQKTVVWLAHELSCSRNNVYKIFQSQSISTHELLRISLILNRNFFEYYISEFNERKGAKMPPQK